MTTRIDTVLNISANVSGQGAVESMRSGLGNLATAFDRLKITQEGVVSTLRQLAVIAGAGAFGEVIKGTAEYGDQIGKLSEKTGIGSAELAKWISAAKLADVSQEQLQGGFSRLTKSIVSAMSGTVQSQVAFRALGISMDDLKNKDMNEIMLEIADGFEKMPNGIGKAALAVQLFGKSGMDLIPLLNGGREEVEGLGTAVTQKFTDMSQIFNDNMTRMSGSTKGLKVEMTTGLLPALIDVQNTILDMIKMGGGMTEFFELIGEGIRLVGMSAMGISNTIGELKDGFVASYHVITGTIEGMKSGKGFAAAYDSANMSAQNEWEGKFQARLDRVQKEWDSLWSHSKIAGHGDVPFNFKPTGTSDAANQFLLGLQNNDPALKKYQESMEKLKASEQEQKQALLDEMNTLGAAKFQIENLKDARETEKKIREAVIGMSPAQQEAYRKEAEGAERERESLRGLVEFQTDMYALKKANREKQEDLVAANTAPGLSEAAIANLNDARETERKLKEAIVGMSPQQQEAYRKEAEGAEKLREATRLYNEEQKTTFDYGMKDWAAKYQRDVSNTAAQTESIMKKSFDGMATSLTDFVMTGKTNFGQLTQSIIADIIKMQIESNILGPLAGMFGGAAGGAGGAASGGFGGFIRNLFGFAGGGVMTSSGPVALHRYAGGGVASSPQLAMFGEGSQNEAFVPLPDGRSIPVSLAKGGSSTNIEFHYHEGTGIMSSSSDGDRTSNVQRLSAMMANAVRGVLINERRPGGMLSASGAGA